MAFDPSKVDKSKLIQMEDPTQRIKRSLAHGFQQDHEKEAEIQSLANDAGVPKVVAQRHTDRVRQQLDLSRVDLSTMQKQAPVTTGSLMDPDFSALTDPDEVNRLADTEKQVGQVDQGTDIPWWMEALAFLNPAASAPAIRQEAVSDTISHGREIAAGTVGLAGQSISSGYEWLFAASRLVFPKGFDPIGDIPIIGPIDEWLDRETLTGANARNIAVRTQQLADFISGDEKPGVNGLVEMTERGLGGMGLQMLAQANPVTGALVLALPGAGQMAQISRKHGTYGTVRSDLATLFSVLPNWLGERLGFDIATRRVAGAVRNSLLRRGGDIVFRGAAELGTELFSNEAQYSLATNVAGIGGLQRGMSTEQMAAAYIIGALVGTPFSLMDPVTRYGREGMDVRKGMTQSRNLGELAKSAQDSTVRQNAPVRYKQYLQKMGSDDKSVFVDGPEVADYLAEKSADDIAADPALQVIQQKLAERETEGQDIQLSLTDFMTLLAASDSFKDIQPFLTTSEGAISVARAQGVDGRQQQFMDDLATAAEENEQARKLLDEAEQVESALAAQLRATGRYSPDAVRAMSKTAASYFTTKAVREGRTPMDVYQEANLTVRGPDSSRVTPKEATPVGPGDPVTLVQAEEADTPPVLLNIGLNTAEIQGEDAEMLTPDQVVETLTGMGIPVQNVTVHGSDTEPTAVVELAEPVTPDQAAEISEVLSQEAVVQRTVTPDKVVTGQMFGPKASAWGPYDPAQFVLPDGSRADAIESVQMPPLAQRVIPDQVEAPEITEATPVYHGKPVRAEAVSVVGYHFGKQPDLPALDPSKAGTGAAGDETNRLMGSGGRRSFGERGGIAARVNFYVSEDGEIPVPEMVVANAGPVTLYRVQLDNLYPLSEDPLGLVTEWRKTQRTGQLDFNVLEQAVADAGFDGVVSSNNSLARVATVFDLPAGDEIPVEQVDYSPKDLSTARTAALKDRRERMEQEREERRASANAARIVQGLPPLYQDDNGVRGYYDPQNTLIRLMETSNETTFLHEFAHFMKDIEERQGSQVSQDINTWHFDNADSVAKEANSAAVQERLESATETITQEDVEAAYVNGSSGDASKDMAIQIAAHEQFARAWETYLMEGKAPNAALRDAFRKFAAWFTEIYKRIRGDLNVPMDADIRKVMDRLIATDAQIAEVSKSAQFSPLFTDATMAGMTEAQWAKYQERQQKTKDSAQEAIRKRLFKRIQRDETAQWQDEKQTIIDDLLPQIENNPVNNARRRLKNDIKLDRRTTKELVGEHYTTKLGTKGFRVPAKLKNMTVTGGEGLSPDDAAAVLGYESGETLLNELVNAPKPEQVAEAQAEAIMVQRHGDILNDGTLDQMVAAAMENEAYTKVLLSELKALGSPQGETERTQIKEIAKDRIAQKSQREIKPGLYRKAEIRAAKRAQQALDQKDQAAAAAAKYEQLVNHYLAEAAQKARDEIDTKVNRLARYRKKSVQQAVQKGGGGHWEAIQKILKKFEFKKTATLKSVQEQNQTLSDWLHERIGDYGDALEIAPEILDETQVTHWKDMPLTQLRAVFDSLKNIEHVARRTNEVMVADERAQHDETVNAMVRKIEKLPKKYVRQRSDTISQTGIGEKVRHFMADMTKIPWLVSWLDGGERVGLMHDVLTSPFDQAFADSHQLLDRTLRPVMDRFGQLSRGVQRKHGKKIPIPEIKTDKHDGYLYGTQIVSVALHTGNPSNLRKLLVGEGWASDDVPGSISLDNPQLQAVLAYMSKEEWDLVQFIWDQMEILYPQLSDTYTKATGLTPSKVDSTPVQTPFGEYRGGYYPMVPDRARAQSRLPTAEESEALFDADMIRQTGVTSSATQERTGATYPVELNLDTVLNHFTDTVHYITYHDAVRSVNRVIRDPRFKQAVTEAFGSAEYEQFPSWLRAIARQGRQTDERRGLGPLLGRLRLGVTYGVMGFKYSTLAAQTLGLSNAAGEVGSANMAWALAHIGKDTVHMDSAMRFVMANSKIMPFRVETFDREAKSALDRLQGKRGAFAGAQEASLKSIGLLQLYAVDLPTWYGAYRKEMQASGDEEAAVKYADWAVENVQGSGRVESMVAMMRDRRETVRIFTQFMTFFSSLWNATRDLSRGAKTGQYSTTDIAARAIFMFVIPGLLDELMRNGIPFDEEDKDKSTEAWKLLASIGLLPLATVPLLRSLASPIEGYQYTMVPVSRVIRGGIPAYKDLIGAAVTDEEATASDYKNAFYLTGVLLHVPGTHQAWSTGSALYDVIAEGEDLTFRELAYGPEE